MNPISQSDACQVRAYLTSLLIHKNHVTPETAQSIANRWQLSFGRDLRGACKGDFIQIFGGSVAVYLDRSVQDDLYTERRSPWSGIIDYWTLGIASVVAICFFARARWLSHTHLQRLRNVLRACLCGPVFLIAGIWAMINTPYADSFVLVTLLGGIMTIIAIFVYMDMMVEMEVDNSETVRKASERRVSVNREMHLILSLVIIVLVDFYLFDLNRSWLRPRHLLAASICYLIFNAIISHISLYYT